MLDRISRLRSFRFPPDLVERITRLDRRIGLAAVGVFVFLVVIIVGVVVMSGGDDNQVAGDGSAIDPSVTLGPDGLPVPSMEDMVAESVLATIEAIPTPTPEATPDVAATLQAQLDYNRKMSPLVLDATPLEDEGTRNPYLSPAELDYFERLGPRLWVYTQVWFHVRRVVSVEVAEWEAESFTRDVEEIQSLLNVDEVRFWRSHLREASPVVRSYAQRIDEGVQGVDAAVNRLSEAQVILAAGELGPEERSQLIRLARDVEYLLDDFDSAMSEYGCSVCGELFRRRAGDG